MNKFKIPTLLGLSVIIVGMVAGVYLTLREQTFFSQAAPDPTPRNITITNITENSVTISWQTGFAVTSFITFGQNTPAEQTALDDKDKSSPKPYLTHYVTLKNLMPKTDYQFKIVSGNSPSEIERFQTAPPLSNQSRLTPVIGSVLANDTQIVEGIAYVSIPGASIQSALVKAGGNFLIPLSDIRNNDLSDYQPEEGVIAKLTIYTDRGEAGMLFNLQTALSPLPPVRIGQNIDLTTELNIYDLNDDGKINAADNAIILQSFGKKSAGNKADLNNDRVVNQKDLDLISQRIKELGGQ